MSSKSTLAYYRERERGEPARGEVDRAVAGGDDVVESESSGSRARTAIPSGIECFFTSSPACGSG